MKALILVAALMMIGAGNARATDHTSTGHFVAGMVITISCIELTELPRPVCFLIPLAVGVVKESMIDENPDPEDAAEWAAGGFVGGTIVTIWRWEF